MNPLVSICIPVYNGEKYLKACLESALGQTYAHIEILVVDDRSTDSSVAIVTDYCKRDSRIRLFQNECNLGLVENWNNSVSLAQGEWIKFLFQDDLMEPDCIKKMTDAITPDSSMIVCKRNFIFDSCPSGLEEHFLEIVRRYNMDTMFPNQTGISPAQATNAFLENSIINFVGEPTAVMLKRTVFERFGMFNTHLIQYCDLEYWIRVASNTGLIYVPEMLVHFRLHSGGTTAANGSFRRFRMFVDKLVCYHEMIFHPAYAQLRLAAARHEPPLNLRQICAAEVQQVRKMALSAPGNLSRKLLDELNEVTRLYPAFTYIKKIPFSMTYDRYIWKLRKLFAQQPVKRLSQEAG